MLVPAQFVSWLLSWRSSPIERCGNQEILEPIVIVSKVIEFLKRRQAATLEFLGFATIGI